MHDPSDETPPPARRRGIYLLPNLLTTAALFAGFYAIVAAMHDRFEAAAVAIFVAMVLDGLDGRVARLTQTQSDFGGQYDSLADMVSFGLAPALVMYAWSLDTLGKSGWVAAFVYTAGAALRLARFNTQLGVMDKRYFQGLASPSAAAVVAGLVWVGADQGIDGRDVRLLTFVVTVLVGLLMVSNLRYRSFKDLDMKNRIPFMVAVTVMLVFTVIFIQPPLVLFSLAALYALSGMVMTALELHRRRRDHRRQEEGGGAAPP
ncbi:MAG TPA: CDP-diacylglycerol--serine O-phosphatidyltransferase [Gammaproteobacteria bacterium]